MRGPKFVDKTAHKLARAARVMTDDLLAVAIFFCNGE
jgi:hypothetical protein